MRYKPGLKDVRRAKNLIKPYALHTPCVFDPVISRVTRARAHLKLESYQPIRTFKIRGAFNKILSLKKPREIVTASSGNHGLAVSYVAHMLGIKATVVVPENAVQEKLDAITGYGAQIVSRGKVHEERYAKAVEIHRQHGAELIHSFDDPLIIAGQGTVGYELAQDMPRLDTVIAPIGGGGLIAGVSLALKNLRKKVRIIGVEPEGASCAFESRKAGRPVEIKTVQSIADGLLIKKPGELCFDLIERFVDDIVLVDDQAILQAVLFLLKRSHVLAEPSAAVTLAALLREYEPKPGENVALIITGGNISLALLKRLLSENNLETSER